MASASTDTSVVRSLLERMKFSVEENISAKGLSGLEHRYDFLLSGEGKRILVAVGRSSPKYLLIELAKALDLSDEVLVLFHGSLPSEFKEITKGRVKVIAFENFTELESKLRLTLGAPAATSSAIGSSV